MSRRREVVLEAVRAALQGREAMPHPGPLEDPPPAPAGEGSGAAPGASGTPSILTAFGRAFRGADGEVVEVGGMEASRWIEAFGSGFRTAACASDLPRHLRPRLPEASPASADVGISFAWAAAADTGSLLLPSGGGRAVQLLPPVHVVWVEAARVHATLAGALEALRSEGVLPPAVGIHTGPSRSADIGQIVVRGVHGPGRVVAVLLV